MYIHTPTQGIISGSDKMTDKSRRNCISGKGQKSNSRNKSDNHAIYHKGNDSKKQKKCGKYNDSRNQNSNTSDDKMSIDNKIKHNKDQINDEKKNNNNIKQNTHRGDIKISWVNICVIVLFFVF